MRNPESPRLRPSAQDWLCRAVLLAVLACNAVGLWPELAVSRVDLNDNVSHFAMVERMVQAAERGENPLDCWSPEWSWPSAGAHGEVPDTGYFDLVDVPAAAAVARDTLAVWRAGDRGPAAGRA